MSVREKRAGMLHTLLEQGDVYPGSYQTGPQFAGPTSDAGIRIKKIEGKSVQAVSHGYQLFDASKIRTQTISGITVTNNQDGSFTISGSAITSNRVTFGGINLAYPIKLKPGTLTLKQGAPSSPRSYVDFYDSSDSYVMSIVCDRPEVTKTVTEEQASRITKAVVLLDRYQNTRVTPTTIRPMLYQDGTGEWEPFTGGKPGPQPEYPLINRSFRAYRFGSNAASDAVLADRQCYLRSLPDGTHDEYVDGKVIRRVGRLFLDGSSDETYVIHEMVNGYTRASFIAPGGEVLQMRLDDVAQCDRLPCADSLRAWANPERECLSPINSNTPGNTGLVIKGSYGQTDLKTWLSAHPLEILYKLGTPVVETLSLPIIPTKTPRTSAWTDSDLEPDITWEALPAGSCALEVQELRKRLEKLESEMVNNA